MPVRLIFGRPRYAGGPVRLVFGDGGAVVSPDPVSVSATVEIEDVNVSAQAIYDNRLARYVGGAVRSGYQVAATARASTGSAWGRTDTVRQTTAIQWRRSAPVAGRVSSGWGGSARVAASSAAVWELAAPAGRATAGSWETADRRAVTAASVWQLAGVVGAAGQSRWEAVRRLQRMAASAWQLAVPQGRGWADDYGLAAAQALTALSRWELARRPPNGRTPGPVGPVDPEDRVPSTHLVFACPRWAGGLVHLVFGHVCVPRSPALVVIPVRTYYMTINSIALRRVDGNVPLRAHSFSMSIDADSWTWSWSATLDRSVEDAVQSDASGDPVELEAVINGVPYRLLVGSVGRSRQFPTARILVRGQGLAAVLAAPAAPVLTHSGTAVLTAQQLMDQVLTVNGQSIGWSVDWGLTDWMVPANAWTFQGTPIEALMDIAGAVGAYLQPHATAQTLRVLPRYPTAPWEWQSVVPDIELPQSVVEVESMDWVDRPAYNRVFVGGTGAGVFGPVTRSGTAGDLVAPQVIHPLITDADAHRQRGLTVLADTGRQVHMNLRLPVLPETGLILPGRMVRYAADQDRLGIVRSMSLDWSSVVMRQTIGVESHAA